MIDRERLLRLHARIVRGDPLATSELFTVVHRALTAVVRRRTNYGMSWEESADIATDAIVEYIADPAKFDPSRAGLLGYLALIAHGDSLNHLRDAKARRKKENRFVELSVASGNDSSGNADLRLDAERILQAHGPEVIRDPGDEMVLRLYLAGEKDTAVYAEALGLQNASPLEQRRQVKVRKDRIEARLKRLKESLDG